MKTNKLNKMNRYFGIDAMRFSNPQAEIEYVSGQLRAMSNDDISDTIAKFSLYPLKIYVKKHSRSGSKFEYSTLEPFMNYLDSYLIEQSGGNVEELKKLSLLILGEEVNYPTTRLMRLGILNEYFKPYLV